MKTNEIKTLQQFADAINSADEWKLDFYDVIKQNGWIDDTHKTFGICHDNREILELDENGNAFVKNIDIEGIVREKIAMLRMEKSVRPLSPDKYEELKRLEELEDDIAQGCPVTLDDIYGKR